MNLLMRQELDLLDNVPDWCGLGNLMDFSVPGVEIRIGTIGDHGEGSERTAKYFARRFLPPHYLVNYELFASLESLENSLARGDIHLAVVSQACPDGYRFYLNPLLQVLFVFIRSVFVQFSEFSTAQTMSQIGWSVFARKVG